MKKGEICIKILTRQPWGWLSKQWISKYITAGRHLLQARQQANMQQANIQQANKQQANKQQANMQQANMLMGQGAKNSQVQLN